MKTFKLLQQIQIQIMLNYNILKTNYFTTMKKGFRTNIYNLTSHYGASVITARHLARLALTNMFHLCIYKKLIYYMHFRVWFFGCCYFLSLPYYFHTALKDLLLVCGSHLDCTASVKYVSRSSLQKAINTANVFCSTQALQTSIIWSKMAPSSLWLPQGHRSLQLWFEMVT